MQAPNHECTPPKQGELHCNMHILLVTKILKKKIYPKGQNDHVTLTSRDIFLHKLIGGIAARQLVPYDRSFIQPTFNSNYNQISLAGFNSAQLFQPT